MVTQFLLHLDFYQENISFLGKAVHLKSSDGPEVTTIDGNKSGSAVVFVDDEGLDSILEGFTITGGTGTAVFNGVSTDFYGGGVFSFRSCPTIRGNIITDNSVAPFTLGGGVACLLGEALIEDNTISLNLGGGIYATGGTLPMVVTGNTVNGNQGGEGIQVVQAFGALIEDNLVFENQEDGIDLNVLDSAIASGNIAMMNGIGSSSSAQNGIRIASCINSEACHNQIFAHDGDGIAVRNSGITEVSDNYVEGCGDDGIFLFVVDRATVARNFSGGNLSTGIAMRNVDFLTCTNNVAAANADDGIEVRSSITATVNGITSVQNSADGFRSASNDQIEISNAIIRDNGRSIGQFLGGATPVLNNSNIQGGFAGIGNIDVDPMFVSANGPDGNPNTVGDNDYRLAAGSPCIDTGDSTNWLCTDVDVDGNPRLIDGLLVGDAVSDIGAHEFNNVYLTVTDVDSPAGLVNVETTGTAGLTIEILVGTELAENCTPFGPVFFNEATAVTFGPNASPVDIQIELPPGNNQFIIQVRAISSGSNAIGNMSNAVTLEFDSTVLIGDVNQDGQIDLLDVQPFVDLLINGGFQLEADINGDGLVNLLDVAGFVALISS